MEYKYEKIGERILKERTEHRYTQDDLINELSDRYISINRTTLSKIENGKKTRSLDVYLLGALADIFNCEIQYLLCEQDYKYRTSQNIHELTGLSETACDALGSLKPEEKALINGFFEDGLMDGLLNTVREFFIKNPEITELIDDALGKKNPLQDGRVDSSTKKHIEESNRRSATVFNYELDQIAIYMLRSVVFNHRVFNCFFEEALGKIFMTYIFTYNMFHPDEDGEEDLFLQQGLDLVGRIEAEKHSLIKGESPEIINGYKLYTDRLKERPERDKRGKHTGKF